MDPRRRELVSRLLQERGIVSARLRPEPTAARRTVRRENQQAQMIALSRLLPAAPLFHINSARELEGALDEARLRRVLHQLLDRHEILRTGYTAQGCTFVARVLP